MIDTPANPLDRLLRLAETVSATEPALSRWLRAGVQAHVETGARLDVVLGVVRAQGGAPARQELLRRERDEHLRRAADLVGGSATRLAAEVGRFECRTWARVRTQDRPSADWPELKRLLFLAFRCGVKVPTTREGLQRAVIGTPQCTNHSNGQDYIRQSHHHEEENTNERC